MNNFELNEQAQTLADTLTPYALAKRVIELDIKSKIVEDYLGEINYKYDTLLNALEFQGIDVDDVIAVFETGCGL